MTSASYRLKANWIGNIVAQGDHDTMILEAKEVGRELAAHGHFFVGGGATNALWTTSGIGWVHLFNKIWI